MTLLFLMEVAAHVQSAKMRKLVIFLKYLKKKYLHLLLCSIVMQNIDLFYRGLDIFVIICEDDFLHKLDWVILYFSSFIDLTMRHQIIDSYP